MKLFLYYLSNRSKFKQRKEFMAKNPSNPVEITIFVY